MQQAFALAEEQLTHDQAASPPPPAPPEPAPAGPLAAPVPTPAAGLGEAPASVNCFVTLAGRQVQVTLRDTCETRLLDRLTVLLQRFPVDVPAPIPTPPPVRTPAEGWCTLHATAMKLNTKEGRTWYSHQVNGAWCKGQRK